MFGYGIVMTLLQCYHDIFHELSLKSDTSPILFCITPYTLPLVKTTATPIRPNVTSHLC